FGRLAFPSLLAAAGLLLFTHSGQRLQRFPSTDLERGLNRLFALLLPTRKATTTATLRIAIAQHTRLSGFRHGARRWPKELRLTSQASRTCSPISASRKKATNCEPTSTTSSPHKAPALSSETTRSAARSEISQAPPSSSAPQHASSNSHRSSPRATHRPWQQQP